MLVAADADHWKLPTLDHRNSPGARPGWGDAKDYVLELDFTPFVSFSRPWLDGPASDTALAVDVEYDRPVEQPVDMAVATMGSSKIFPQDPTPQFVVSTVEPFR